MVAATMERVEQVWEVLDFSAKKTQREYRSRKGALVWCLGKSRDNWKAKYSEVKAQLDASQRKLKYALHVKEVSAVEIAVVRTELAAAKAKTADSEKQLTDVSKKISSF